MINFELPDIENWNYTIIDDKITYTFLYKGKLITIVTKMYNKEMLEELKRFKKEGTLFPKKRKFMNLIAKIFGY